MSESDPRNDVDLVSAATAGDVAAFEALYHRHRDWVVGLAWRFTGSEDLALDVLQETFIYLLDKLPNLHLTARLTTFLYPAVKNLSIAARRKARRLEGNEAALEAAPSPVPSAGASRADLSAALAGLSEERREVVLMRFVDDLSLDEIAQALSIPLGTVKSRLHLALEALRQDPVARRFFEA